MKQEFYSATHRPAAGSQRSVEEVEVIAFGKKEFLGIETRASERDGR